MLRALLLASMFLLPVALADHENGCTPGDGFRTAEAGDLYLWAIGDASGHVSFGVWQGSNDIAGLQRWDVVFDETCGGHYPADTEIAAFYMI